MRVTLLFGLLGFFTSFRCHVFLEFVARRLVLGGLYHLAGCAFFDLS